MSINNDIAYNNFLLKYGVGTKIRLSRYIAPSSGSRARTKIIHRYVLYAHRSSESMVISMYTSFGISYMVTESMSTPHGIAVYKGNGIRIW